MKRNDVTIALLLSLGFYVYVASLLDLDFIFCFGVAVGYLANGRI
jgi:hypothetical protein